MNIHGRIWQMHNLTDDEIGGARISGTISKFDLPGRFEEAKPSMLLLQQGLETPRICMFQCTPGVLEVYERDELEIIAPQNHYYYGDHFRIIGVNRSSLHPSDSRSQVILYMNRVEYSHHAQ